MGKLLFLAAFLSAQIIYGQQIPLSNKPGGIPVNAKPAANSIKVGIIISNPGTGIIYFDGNVAVTQAAGARISAGVYAASDGTLLKTLTSNNNIQAINSIFWDGKDEAGNVIPIGTQVNFNITSNALVDTWCTGIIGNTSTDLIGDGVIVAPPVNMCFSANKGYASNGYSEHSSVLKSFNLTDPNKYTSAKYNVTTQSTYQMWTDGTIIYCAGAVLLGTDGNGNSLENNWIYGQYVSADTNPATGIVPFPSGVVEDSNNSGTGNVHYDYALSDTKSDYKGRITALEGQQSGNFLFAARNLKNELQVLDRRPSSGALLQTLTFANIKGIGCDDNNNMYIVYNNAVQKFTINSDGTLTNQNVSFTGITTPNCLAVSPDGSKIFVSDDATKQVLVYNPSGGAPVYTLGVSGGYTSSPLAGNAKFYDINYIKFQKDGSFWIGDTPSDPQESVSNNRAVHYNADYSYKEASQHIPSFRSAHIDLNNPTRYFAGFLEFRRDYSKPLDNGKNGSWYFYANWAKYITSYDVYQKFGQVITLSNGRTYAYAGGQFYELIDGSGARATGVTVGNNQNIGKDGTLFTVNDYHTYITVTQQPLTFDGNNNPVWGASSIFATSPTDNYYQTYSPATAYDQNTGHTKDSPGYIFFNYKQFPYLTYEQNPQVDYHLGFIQKGGNAYKWQTARGTALDYRGEFPSNGDFDIGNGSGQHTYAHAMIVGRFIIAQNANEFWKSYDGGAYQNNIHNFFYDNGLFLAQGGMTGQKASLLGNSAQTAAGNAYGTDAILDPNGNITLAYCDEGQHGGIGTFTISGLNTVQENIIPVTITQAIVTAEDKTDLMRGLPYRSRNFTGGNGWSFNRTPAAGSTFYSYTSYLTYQKNNIDVFVVGQSNTESFALRSLEDQGVNNTNNYSLTGKLCWFVGKSFNNYQSIGYSVLDANGNNLVVFDVITDSSNGYLQSVKINGVTVQSGYEYLPFARFIQIPQDFYVKSVNGQITAGYAGYSITINSPNDSGGDFTRPSAFKVHVYSPNAQLDVQELKFSKSASGVAQ